MNQNKNSYSFINTKTQSIKYQTIVCILSQYDELILSLTISEHSRIFTLYNLYSRIFFVLINFPTKQISIHYIKRSYGLARTSQILPEIFRWNIQIQILINELGQQKMAIRSSPSLFSIWSKKNNLNPYLNI